MPTFMQLWMSNPAAFGQAGQAFGATATRLDVAGTEFTQAVKSAEEGWQGPAKNAQSAAAGRVNATLDRVSHAAVRGGAVTTGGGLQLTAAVTQLRTFCQQATGLGFLVLPAGVVVPGPTHYSQAAAAGPGAPAVLQMYQTMAQVQTQAITMMVTQATALDNAKAAELRALGVELRTGQATSRTPRTDARRANVPEGVEPWLWEQWNRGHAFNETREPYYTARGGANELYVGGGNRVDSYVPGAEIVSRKDTQLAGIQPRTARGYIDNLVDQYGPGTAIDDVPSNNAQLPGIGGGQLDGQMFLEVPPQTQPVPREIIEYAAERDIVIRDALGNILM
jgi:hypothetical protein